MVLCRAMGFRQLFLCGLDRGVTVADPDHLAANLSAASGVNF